MLRRFQQISGIGCYSACRSGKIQFENMSLVYGENCYGKSTLCDILRSLAENEATYITERISVPIVDEGRQCVQLSFMLPGEQQETPITFRQGSWNPTLPDALRVEIFDTDFIHRNLFTGLTIQRENHENITRFVFGDTGVTTAQRIADINSELRAINRRLLEWRDNLFTSIQDLTAFLNLDVTDEPQLLEQRVSEQLAALESEQRIARDLDGVRARPKPWLYPIPPNLDTITLRVEEALARTFEQAHEDAETKLRNHLESHSNDSPQARTWVQQGLPLIRDEECPFCGQVFSETAANLIAAYQTVFNDAYHQYVNNIISTLNEAQVDYSNRSLADLRLHIEQNRQVFHQYPELRNRADIHDVFGRIDEISIALIQQWEEWDITHTQFKESLAEAIQRKKENIHMAAQPWRGDLAADQLQLLTGAIDAYNSCLQTIIDTITHFKGGLDTEQTVQRIQSAQRELDILHLRQRRLDLDTACQQYSGKSTRYDELREEVEQLQVTLDREQTEFSQRYFAAINRIFSLLGSRRFTITAEHSRRGNMPTVQLRVSYNGEPITHNRLRACFSESDRRALALAVFWARLETREADNLARTIVVLDDPVTSFDDGRIDKTIRLIETYLPQLRQLIILSHYAPYLRTFFNRLHGRLDGILLAKLYQDASSTQIANATPLDFIENSHQRAYRRISRFIQREHTEDILRDLRVFLETEVLSRYYRAIDTNNLHGNQFKSLLDELVRLDVMTTDTRQAIEPFRLTLNVEHHNWTEHSHEEKITLAEDLLQIIYDRL